MFLLNRFNRAYWPTLFDDDFFPVVLAKGSSLSVKANEDNDQVIYELSIPKDVDTDSIEATKVDGILKVTMQKVKPKVEPAEDKTKVKIK